MSSSLKKQIEDSPKLRELRRTRKQRRVRLTVLLVILFFTICGGFVYAMHDNRILINTVVVSGNKVVDTEEIQNHINKFLNGSYFYLIPHRNSFFYPKEKIISDLTVSFPGFKQIEVYRSDMNTLFVSVVEIRGYALWCGFDNTPISLDAPCYFTDDTGKIISTAPHYSGNVYPRFFGTTLIPENSDPLGNLFITSTQFTNLLAFEKRVEDLGFSVEAIKVGTGEEYSFVLDVGQNKTALIRFMEDANYQTLADNLSVTLAKNEIANLIKTDKNNLEYFDLRFTNKVYYKFSDK